MKSKRYKKLPEKTNLEKPNSIKNLIPIIKKNCTTKFDESIDLSILINNKQKKNEINIRTAVNLPSGTGKKIKIAVVAEESKQKDAKNSGADLVGGDDLIDKIKLICTTSMMIKLSKLGKILGPKGLMPNPKLGTVTDDISEAVKNAKAGQIELKNDKDGNIGLSFGKKSFSDESLIKNFNTILDILEKEKSNLTIKGDLVRNIFVTSTMGVSYKVKMDRSF